MMRKKEYHDTTLNRKGTYAASLRMLVIGLTDEEVTAMTEDLNNIIESLKPITEYDLEGVEPTFHPYRKLVKRYATKMLKGQAFTQEEALSNAPKQQDGSFLIPAILGGGDQ